MGIELVLLVCAPVVIIFVYIRGQRENLGKNFPPSETTVCKIPQSEHGIFT